MRRTRAELSEKLELLKSRLFHNQATTEKGTEHTMAVKKSTKKPAPVKPSAAKSTKKTDVAAGPGTLALFWFRDD